MPEDCVFCKIIKGEIPCAKIYENDKVLAFLGIEPINKGHTIVIPKEHHKDLLSMPDDILAEVTKITKKVSKAVVEATGADGFNIGQNNGKAAGQAVFHFHIHIMPRFENDGLKHWSHKEYSEGEMNEFAEKISNAL